MHSHLNFVHLNTPKHYCFPSAADDGRSDAILWSSRERVKPKAERTDLIGREISASNY
jgi:hypothetical protein